MADVFWQRLNKPRKPKGAKGGPNMLNSRGASTAAVHDLEKDEGELEGGGDPYSVDTTPVLTGLFRTKRE